MAPKWKHIPLLFLISLFGLFILSRYFHPQPQLSATSSDLPLRTPAASPFSFTVKVLAFDRLSSLSRCLLSLAASDYGADAVNLHIYIDHFKHPEPPATTSSVDDNLQNAQAILDFVHGFDWKFGHKLVHYRTVNVGLQAQWLEAWWPTSDDEFVFVVEDDMEVSPLYYKFLKALIFNYYYNQSNFSPSIYGASLQRPSLVPGKHGNKMHLDHDNQLLLYQLVGTWGQLLFPKPWKEFRIWYDIHKAKGMKPFLDGMVTDVWYRRMGERIWTPWFLKFIHSRGYFNLYTNFPDERALSVSHREAGVSYRETEGPDSYLLNQTNIDFNLLDMKPLSVLKWYEFCFREVLPGRVVKTVPELGTPLSSMQKQKPVFVISLHKASDPVIANLLCHFQRLNVQNYILVTHKRKYDFVLDLARRGHHVIDAIHFLDSMGYHKPYSEIIVTAYITNKCLVAGLDSYIVDGKTTLLINSPLVVNDSSMYDFYACKASGVLHVRSTSSSRRAWDRIFSRADSIPTQKENGSFASLMVELLEKMGVEYTTLDETSTMLKLDSISANQSSLGVAAKFVYWSSSKGLDAVQNRLAELGMWIVDAESSCIAIFCHQ